MRLVRWVCEDYAGLCMCRSMDSMDYGKVELLVERYIVNPDVFLGGAAREEGPRVHMYGCFIAVASPHEDNE